jgi:protein SCO1/2
VIEPTRTTRRALLAGLAGLAALALAACERPPAVVYSHRGQFHATEITGVDWGRGLGLDDHGGRRRTLAEFRGKVVMLFFGFTNCPDVCPTALAEMAQVVDRLGPDGARVQVLFVTVDPERDTAAVLAKHVTAFHPSFIGLRGSSEETARTAAEFKVHYPPKREAGAPHDMVDHAAGIFVFDPAGRLRLYAGAGTRTVDHLLSDVRRLLRPGSETAWRSK